MFRGARFTRVNNFCSFLLAAIATSLFYGALVPLHATYFAEMFTQRGFVPYTIVALFFWSLAILILKIFKLRLQRQTLQFQIVPENPEFVLSPATVGEVTRRLYEFVDEPRQFILFNRIEIALANLRNLGRVGDLDEILRSQGEQDESTLETSYSVVNGFVWAIPVLGFIGTVEGLSQSIGGFGTVLSTTEDLSQIKSSLQLVTGGLAVAFETTLQGLVAALIVQMLLTMTKKKEEEFLDDCSEYCVRNVVGRLRLTPYQSGSGT
ncbi:MotA/TolQ/ExbB proton channel family protein [Planctomicrobium piriforme]|uniref:Biopolymer transport protein ExbB/TolQ n=1 Tax=Planctomicrobium piriforme TaxID=1576369 RepID=A0A1I3MYZ7_9PLAN|nr:MotA/TolQ/ExbB proton channel family protein [Planctomicrobium piriforme]SFJ01995.1 Biopolymer transport protein ExbB/TolQ [Planctomicrobium piriforme]